MIGNFFDGFSRHWKTFVFLGLLIAQGCAHRPSKITTSVSEQLPESFAVVSGEAALPARWWESFNDPRLNALITHALTNHFDIERAWARLEQAAATAGISRSERFPQLNFEASGRRSRAVSTTPAGESSVRFSNLYGLSLAAAYEVDLWGRVAASSRAARREYEASRADLESAATTIAAELAEAWFSLLEQQTLADLIRSQIAAAGEYLQLTEFRFAQGQSSSLDVYQQRQQEATLLALLPGVEARMSALKNQISVLIGEPPGFLSFEVKGEWPELPSWPDAGVPGDLLERRPDVRAGLLRLTAADERRGAARAARLPTLRLTAAAGYQDSELDSLFDDWIGNLAAGLVGPLVDGGRRRSEVQRAESALREQSAALRGILLRALREVSDALQQEQHQMEAVDRQKQLIEAAQQTLVQSRRRYMGGLSDYLTVLVALDRRQAAERSLVTSRRQLISYRIQLYRALGGEWTFELQDPSWQADRHLRRAKNE